MAATLATRQSGGLPGRPGCAISAVQGLSTTETSTIASRNNERPARLRPNAHLLWIDHHHHRIPRCRPAHLIVRRLLAAPASTGQPRNKAVDLCAHAVLLAILAVQVLWLERGSRPQWPRFHYARAQNADPLGRAGDLSATSEGVRITITTDKPLSMKRHFEFPRKNAVTFVGAMQPKIMYK